MKLTYYLTLTLVLGIPLLSHGQDWTKIESILGRKGAVKDGMLKVTFPRSDLAVTIGDVKVEPGLALTSWMGFMQHGSDVMVMGDIVLLDKELPQVEQKLIESGIAITAIHNHLAGETPAIKYMHIEGEGDPADLARKLKEVFALTGTPTPTQNPPAAPQIDWSYVESTLARKGNHNGNILSFGIPRADKITENGMEMPSYMGMATAINIQRSRDRIQTTGDFVLLESEVKPVMKALYDHGITATALHNHMLEESPRMFMMHFWGDGSEERIAEGLKAALAKTNSQKP
jgi:hypothetical protein